MLHDPGCIAAALVVPATFAGWQPLVRDAEAAWLLAHAAAENDASTVSV